jgi:hypothetical protein
VGAGIIGPEASNGRFDYVCFLVWSGAKTTKIKPQSTFTYVNGITTAQPTPIYCEEDSRFVNASNMEGGHSNNDPMSIHHRGGSHYASIDGSVHYFIPRNQPNPSRSDNAFDWSIVSGGGATVRLGEYSVTKWGWFNSQ